MDTFIQQVVSGLATGSIYAALALALVMIYEATDVVNFAQGEMAMFATYVCWSLLDAGMPYWAAFFATLAIAFAGGVASGRIGLGHQLLGLAMGGTTFKLKFGHRGGNQPVKDLRSGKVEITSQNHGFCVDINSLKGKGVELTHINLNDETLEGMRHKQHPIFSVQYHPEASPGPHDARYLFDDFFALTAGNQP